MADASATVRHRSRIPAIWLVPIIAAILGLWVVVYDYMTQGPEITIQFKTAEGIEAGKTKIKALNVDLGTVESVKLTKDMSAVVVKATLESFAKPLLREDTEFWVVRPRVGPAGVSGLGTILSGGYIELAAGAGKTGRKSFVGLDSPPVTEAGTPGLRLTLVSDSAGALMQGNPVLYKDFEVGRVESVKLDPDKRSITYEIFIDEKYTRLVTDNTKFWNISGVSLKASAQGLDLDVGSIESILIGGVAFGLPDNAEPGTPAANGDEFELLASRDQINDVMYKHHIDLVVSFEQSLRGLEAGAPVEYRGMEIGTVQRIMIKDFLQSQEHKLGAPLPVLVRFEPGRVGFPDTEESIKRLDAMIREGVDQGLRGSLQTGNLLTGQQLVAFDFYPDAPAANISEFEGYVEIPTLKGGLGQIQLQISALLAKLNKLPLEPVVRDLNQVLVSLRDTLDSVNGTGGRAEGQIPASLDVTLRELNATLDALSPDSQAGEQFSQSMSDLNQALSNLENLVRQLNERPSRLIFSTPVKEDPLPQKGQPE